MGVLTFLPSTLRTIAFSEMLTRSPLRASPLRVLSSAADVAGATNAKTSKARRRDIGRNLTKGNVKPRGRLKTPPPRPLPAAERGSRRFFSPSPSRGGGRGEGLLDNLSGG